MSKAHSVIQADTVMGLANDSSNVTVPDFPPVSAKELNEGKVGNRVVRVPANRMTPLRENWMQLYTPIVENMKLEIRMNKKTRCVEIRTGEETEDAGALQKAADFLQAFVLGFAVEDAIALLRLDDLYLETFDVKDVKELKGDHLSRAVGRIAGKDGKTKFAIENATRTRIVVADTKIHILGSFQNMRLARNAISNLIMGSPPGKVYNKLKNVSKRLAERF
jgi:RNA-binding protein PNO1